MFSIHVYLVYPKYRRGNQECPRSRHLSNSFHPTTEVCHSEYFPFTKINPDPRTLYQATICIPRPRQHFVKTSCSLHVAAGGTKDVEITVAVLVG